MRTRLDRRRLQEILAKPEPLRMQDRAAAVIAVSSVCSSERVAMDPMQLQLLSSGSGSPYALSPWRAARQPRAAADTDSMPGCAVRSGPLPSPASGIRPCSMRWRRTLGSTAATTMLRCCPWATGEAQQAQHWCSQLLS